MTPKHRGRAKRDDDNVVPDLAVPDVAVPDLRITADDNLERFVTELAVAERRSPRQLSRVPRLIGSAARMVWRADRASTCGIVLAQLLLAGVAAAQVFLGGFAVRELLKLREGSSIGQSALALVLLTIVSAVGSLGASGTSQFGRLLGAKVQGVVTGQILDVTTRVELVEYEDADFYDQLSRVLANVPTRPFVVVTYLASLIGGLAGAATLLITLLVLAPILVPILLLGAVPLWLVSRQEGRLEFRFALEQTPALRERNYLEEMLSRRQDAAELRAYGSARFIRDRWEALYAVNLGALRSLVRRRYLLSGLAGLLSGAVALMTLLALVLLIKHGSIGLAEAAAAAVAVRLLVSRLEQIATGLSQLFESALFLADYENFLTRRPVQAASPRPLPPFQTLRLGEVTFRYPGSTNDAVRGVSLEVKRGEVVALVGENGSGKTTLAKIMAGLYGANTGSVVLNGISVDSSARPALREQVALVLQDFTKYALTAADNIALGRPERPRTPQGVTAAAQRVDLDELLAALPAGYETRLSKMFVGGRDLSQGQWQRVALARAFYRDAPLVILDEPTAALDPRAEATLYESVRSVLHGRTVVLITHRLASVRSADRIVVLRDGMIVEEGTHDHLIATGGQYAELLKLQQNHHIRATTPTGGTI